MTTDQYGGLLNVGATGYFRLEKFGSRWMLVDPLGNPFFFLGVALVSSGTPGVDPSGKMYWDYAKVKYAGAPGSNVSATWASQTKAKLQKWGFNGLSWGTSLLATSFAATGHPAVAPLLPHFNEHTAFALHSMTNVGHLLSAPVKNLVGPLKITSFPDVFDPAFSTYGFTAMSTNIHGTIGFPAAEYQSPWVVGVITDELDELKGFGNRQTHPHLGWMTLATAPTQTTGTLFGVTYTYSDTTVYSKLALRDFLSTRYNASLSSLNLAWGSNYTSWDSAGGWGLGTGLLDENGKHTWMGSNLTLAGETPTMQKDLDDFLLLIAQKYFQVCHDAIRAVDTNHLIVGPDVVAGPDTRPQVLQAAAQYLDAFLVNPHHLADTVNPVADTYNQTGRPFIGASKVFLAEPDSPLAANPTTTPCCNASLNTTQAARGQAYTGYLQALLQLRGTDGVYPVIGYSWWALADNFAEKANYGLVTTKDNAYDAIEAVMATGVDANGFTTGGEIANYGDSLTAIRVANQGLLNSLTNWTG